MVAGPTSPAGVSLMTPPHLEPLKRKLMKAALDLLSYADSEEFNLFDALPGGGRLVIEIAILPPVTRECEGAQRARPPRIIPPAPRKEKRRSSQTERARERVLR